MGWDGMGLECPNAQQLSFSSAFEELGTKVKERTKERQGAKLFLFYF